MRFLRLAVKFFIQEYKEIFSLIQSRKGVYPQKKSSRRLVDKEIFLTHWAKLCLVICNKCVAIYYKIEGEGLPSKRSFFRLLANEKKKQAGAELGQAQFSYTIDLLAWLTVAVTVLKLNPVN